MKLPEILLLIAAAVAAPIAAVGSVHAGAKADRSGEGEVRVVRAAPGKVLDPLTAPDTGRSHADTNVDPGIAPEGDYLGWETFTRDGARVLLSNRMTDNVTVFDWATMAPLANIPVGRYPAGIACSNRYAVVACAFGNEVDVIDLADYSVAAAIPTAEQPWVVRVSPDGNTAYVSCDIPDVCEVIDLVSLTHVRTITGFPIGLLMFSFNSENSRNSVVFTNFELTPDGVHLVVPDFTDSVLFINAATGAVDYAVGGCPSAVAVALSGDGTQVVAVSSTNPIAVYRIDIASHTRTGSVALAGYQVGMTYDPAVNQDGSKAFLSISSNSSAFVRFATSDFRVLTSTYSPFWIGVSPDHSLAISGQTYFSVLLFATESLVGQRVVEPQAYGAVSPVGSRIAAHDPTRHEGIYFMDYAVPSNPSYRGTTNAGLDPEGDAPRRVAITPNGARAIVTNVLSDDATIVNLASKQVEAIVPIGDRVQDVAVTSDSRYAVVCGFNTNSVLVIDLSTDAVVANVPTGSRPTNLSISSDNQYAYVGNISSNTVSTIRLAGAASQSVAETACGEIGTVWADFGVPSDVRVSPTGRYVLVAVSFDDQVKVIDTTSHAVVKTLTAGDFPLQVAFTSDGQYAIVTNYFSNNFTLIRVDGASSAVIGTYSASGQGPLRLAYNPAVDRTGIGNYTTKNLATVNPRTGAFISSTSYAAYGEIDQVMYDEAGSPLVLTNAGNSTPAHLHRGTEAIELPAVPCTFDYCPAVQKAAVVMPGPDWMTVIDWNPAGAPEVSTIPLAAPGRLDPPSPNPASGAGLRFAFELARAGVSAIDLVDASGRRVASVPARALGAGRHEVAGPAGLAPGVYYAVLRLDGKPVDRRRVVIL